MCNITSSLLTNDTLVAYIYGVWNRLLSVDGMGSTPSVGYAYDPAGNRIAMTNAGVVTRFVVDPNTALSRVLIRIRPGVTNYYIYGLGLLYEVTETATNSYQRYYHYDYRGSTVALTDSNGNVTDRIEYSAYGTITYRTGATDTPFLFNGRYGVQTDPNGLLYMRARYYNPYICRFINPDPIGFAGGLNWYAYADGDPINYLDPFGLWSWNQTVGVLRAVGGALEAAVGYSLAAASAALGGATSWSGVGAVAGGAGIAAGVAIGAHGVDQLQAGVRQAWKGHQVDSLTSQGLQAAGMSRDAANLTDTGISILGSFDAGVATAALKVSTIAVTDPLAQGLSKWQVFTRWEIGSKALLDSDFIALGGTSTSPLAKYEMMRLGVNAAGAPYQISTTWYQSAAKAFTWKLLKTGPTPGGNIGIGAVGGIWDAGVYQLQK